jgi:LemA protein
MGITLILLVFLVVAVAVIAVGVGIYNGLVRSRNAYRNAFAQIDVQLQRRFDLIPNVVETAKAYMSHERQTLEAVIAARSPGLRRPRPLRAMRRRWRSWPPRRAS